MWEMHFSIYIKHTRGESHVYRNRILSLPCTPRSSRRQDVGGSCTSFDWLIIELFHKCETNIPILCSLCRFNARVHRIERLDPLNTTVLAQNLECRWLVVQTEDQAVYLFIKNQLAEPSHLGDAADVLGLMTFRCQRWYMFANFLARCRFAAPDFLTAVKLLGVRKFPFFVAGRASLFTASARAERVQLAQLPHVASEDAVEDSPAKDDYEKNLQTQSAVSQSCFRHDGGSTPKLRRQLLTAEAMRQHVVFTGDPYKSCSFTRQGGDGWAKNENKLTLFLVSSPVFCHTRALPLHNC